MKIFKKDLKKGEIGLIVEDKEDLWYLNYLIDPEDEIKGRTIRKIKIGDGTSRKQNIIKKPVFIRLKAAKTEFEPEILRVRGVITAGPEDVPKGSYHSLNVEIGTKLTIVKKQWLKYQLEKLNEAAEKEPPRILIVVHDREEAYFALMQRFGYKILGSIKGQVAKKAEAQTAKDFYKELEKQILEYNKRYSLKIIIIASPAFFKEDLMKIISKDIKKKIILATCSSVNENGIKEVLKREETKTALKQERIAEEMKLVEELLTEISKQGKAVYGTKETKSAVETGATAKLLITEKFILKQKEKEGFREVDLLMKTVESMKGEVHIISSEHEWGAKLDGLGGIGAITRWQVV